MNEPYLDHSESAIGESSFISRVYMWMSGGLMVSAMASVWLLTQPNLMKLMFSNPWIFYGVLFAELGLVIWLSAALYKLSPAMAKSIFLIYSFLNGLTLSWIFLAYTGGSILTTFFVTAGTFFFFSMYGLTTKRDLTSVGGFMAMGLIGVVIASVVNIFLKSSVLEWVVTFAGIAVFLGLTAWDTQKLKALYRSTAMDESMEKNAVVLGALQLYLDFINLFIFLLRIFGRRRD